MKYNNKVVWCLCLLLAGLGIVAVVPRIAHAAPICNACKGTGKILELPSKCQVKTYERITIGYNISRDNLGNVTGQEAITEGQYVHPSNCETCNGSGVVYPNCKYCDGTGYIYTAAEKEELRKAAEVEKKAEAERKLRAQEEYEAFIEASRAEKEAKAAAKAAEIKAEREENERLKREREEQERAKQVRVAKDKEEAKRSITTFVDSRDKKVYKKVKIGGKWWMAENLNYAKSGSKCYGNIDANCAKYGRLYNWDTALKACPVGFHLSTSEDWETLLDNVDDKLTAGTKLKATSGWTGGDNGTDDYGFSALPGGLSYGKNFSDVGYYGNWWSAKENATGEVPLLQMHSKSKGVNEIRDGGKGLYSVRCVQD
jgi:uncharacterized protein (TIGR02145 family)